MRVAVRVKPGASRTKVGGRYGDGELVVAVTDPALDGRATSAALLALAKALGLKPHEVRLVNGATRRTKIIELPDSASDAVADLLQVRPGRTPAPPAAGGHR